MAKSQSGFSVASPHPAIVNGFLPAADMNSSTETPSALTPLQTRVAREILALARREDLAVDDRLAESVLAEKIGTSRTPVNVALHHLVSLGVVYYDANRGFFMAKPARDVTDVAAQFFNEPDDPLYLKIAEDRLAQRTAPGALAHAGRRLARAAVRPRMAVHADDRFRRGVRGELSVPRCNRANGRDVADV